jgi:hypothetical protein
MIASRGAYETISQRPMWKQHCNIYRGGFEEGERHGHGSFFYASGSQYCGQWNRNKKHGEGIFYHNDGRIFYGLFSNDYIDKFNDSLPMNKNSNNVEASDVTTQYYLNIHDVLLLYTIHEHPSKDSNRSRDDIKEAFVQESKECERILLQYHSYLKQAHREVCNRSNKYRMKSLTLSRYVESDEKILKSLSAIERVMYNTRQFHPCRLYSATIDSVQLFMTEVGLIDPLIFNYADMKAMLRAMRLAKSSLTKQKRWDYSAQASTRGINTMKYNKEYRVHELIQVYSQSNDQSNPWITPNDNTDLRDPILEHEFVELIVRCIANRQMIDYSFHLSNASNRYHALSKIVYKYFAEQVFSSLIVNVEGFDANAML